ncbi:inner membrane protein YrbG, predicted calcium/sodium:proton antiporter [Lachnospiraceae bacterium KM106-2]|nr:inner membrane protein YrbG, predicted calcium/sodium:proton antiporter [Lachnospiraceae bacterium KM106-2]
MMYVWLLIGFVLLIKGADYFVEGSSSVARLLKVPAVIIGLTIVAMGTSAPEAAVSITAGLSGNNELSLSNVVGSNIFNLLVVIGVCAIIKPFASDKAIVKRDLPVNIGATVLVALFLIDRKISTVEAIVALLCMVVYIGFLIRSAAKDRVEIEEEMKILSPLMSTVCIVGGIIAIILGGNLVVNSASDIAASFGMSQTLIGLTIVAVGTSLPELVTSIVASRKGESGLALGNAVGSSIFNLLFILGLSASLHPITVLTENVIDVCVLLVVSVFLWLVGKSKGKVTRVEGFICVAFYIAYMVYAVIR